MSADMVIQMAKVRRESIRWFLITALNVSRPAGAGTQILLAVVQSAYRDATEQEVRRELDYLEERKLVTIEKDPLNRWTCDLTRHGIDVAEYTIDCGAGIARPSFAG